MTKYQPDCLTNPTFRTQFDAKQKTLLQECNEHLPGYMIGGFMDYILYGRSVGDFLSKVFENDLMGVYDRADDVNRKVIYEYTFIMFNYTPALCYGSKEKKRMWHEVGGLVGVLKQEQDRIAEEAA